MIGKSVFLSQGVQNYIVVMNPLFGSSAHGGGGARTREFLVFTTPLLEVVRRIAKACFAILVISSSLGVFRF